MQNFRARREQLRKTNVILNISIFYFLNMSFFSILNVGLPSLKTLQQKKSSQTLLNSLLWKMNLVRPTHTWCFVSLIFVNPNYLLTNNKKTENNEMKNRYSDVVFPLFWPPGSAIVCF